MKTLDKNTSVLPSQLAQLADFLNSKKPLLLIIGEKNTGKTHFIQKILNHSNVTKAPITVRADKSITPRQILKTICQIKNTPLPANALRFEEQLKIALKHFESPSETYQLCIDDAHTMPFSTLAALSHLALLQENNSSHLQIILTGNHELKTRFNCLVKRPLPVIELTNNLALDTTNYLEALQAETQSITLNSNGAKNSTYLFNQFNTFWQHHHIKAISLCSFGLIASLLFYTPPPTHTTTLTTLAKADAKQRAATTHYDIILANSTQKKALVRLAQDLHLKTTTRIQYNKPSKQFRILVGHFNSYKKANQFLTHLPKTLSKHHPRIHKIIS